MKNILVTGSKGQLAKCIKDLENELDDANFIFVGFDDLDITNKEQVVDFFENHEVDYCINCAAYTAVDKAETEFELVQRVNETGVQYLAESCKKHDIVLIQVSTDFVFDGKQSTFYTENDKAIPLGVYGVTKLNGEIAAIKYFKKHFIIRTSWLYSEHGNNFLKTMLKLGRERDKLNVVCDQIGTPTYAGDLADVILRIIAQDNCSYGTYHYSNEGIASWYDFAKAIFEESNTTVELRPIKTIDYPTSAERPSFSVMDKTKIKEELNIEIPYWRDSLKRGLVKLDMME